MDSSSITPIELGTVQKRIIIFIIILAFIGFVDSLYLSANSILGITPPCFITEGCDVVTTSKYSTILGIPMALVGAVYYLFLFLASLFILEKRHMAVKQAIAAISGFGFVFSLWLVYAQIFLIEAICTYCMISAITTTLIFISSVFLLKQRP
ncbi:MAG: hypothetical protein A2653_02435 [Candidatus Zambryskibacteria bacterium RIFCSPHIGHO2_01_FULL_43_25]|nr:MAG: hypothetical protein A2653_02435 [Candidatus Zambryskibacteria bacterium RIFCSPHIGHO2_01_FULL_43_25]